MLTAGLLSGPGWFAAVRSSRGHWRRQRGSRDQVCGAVPPARQAAADQRAEAGDDVLRPRPVRDVLARERVGVQLRPQIAGIDPPDADGVLLGGQYVRRLLQRGLDRAVS